MALTPTEREEHFFKAMVDSADGSTPEELEPTERKEHWYKEIIDAIAAGGGGSGGGGVLVVHDVDGTLDKTFAEIAASPLTVILMFGGELHLTVDFAGDAKGLSVTAYYGASTTNYAWSAASADSYPTRSA